MSSHRYEANRQTIGALLSTTSPKIEVPEWQRSYSWRRQEVEIFWQDLIAFDAQYPLHNINNQEYFLGSIVLVSGATEHLLLDGQQRLATATILLSAIRDAMKQYKDDAATRVQNKYISDFDDLSGSDTPVLSLNTYDRRFFWQEIQDVHRQGQSRPTPKYASHKLIRDAREFFDHEISSLNQREGGGRAAFEQLLRIVDVLCKHMSVVSVASSDEDNAATVFETLNDRGINLSTPDLLRNLLIRRAALPNLRSQVVDAWEQVLEIYGEVRVDEYLRHYWVSRRGDVKARRLYREIKQTIVDENLDSVSLSRNLAETAAVYRDLVNAEVDNPQLKRELEAVRALGARVLYPALLSGQAAVEGDLAAAEFCSFASALVSLYVRYNVAAGRETTILEKGVYETASKLRGSHDFSAALGSLRVLLPSDEEFVSQFAKMDVTRIATARYLLTEIEHAMRRTEELAVRGPDSVHVEHIYPKSPIGDRHSNHNEIVNRLGNMTLLDRRLNTSIKNVDFQRKTEEAYAASELLLTKQLLEYDEWTEEAIQARQSEMSELAPTIWPFPD